MCTVSSIFLLLFSFFLPYPYFTLFLFNFLILHHPLPLLLHLFPLFLFFIFFPLVFLIFFLFLSSLLFTHLSNLFLPF